MLGHKRLRKVFGWLQSFLEFAAKMQQIEPPTKNGIQSFASIINRFGCWSRIILWLSIRILCTDRVGPHNNKKDGMGRIKLSIKLNIGRINSQSQLPYLESERKNWYL